MLPAPGTQGVEVLHRLLSFSLDFFLKMVKFVKRETINLKDLKPKGPKTVTLGSLGRIKQGVFLETCPLNQVIFG